MHAPDRGNERQHNNCIADVRFCEGRVEEGKGSTGRWEDEVTVRERGRGATDLSRCDSCESSHG